MSLTLETCDPATELSEQGFVILRGAMPLPAIDTLLDRVAALASAITGRSFRSATEPDLAAHLAQHPGQASALYRAVRVPSWLQDLACRPELARAVRGAVGRPVGLLSKVVLRTDLPLEARELAVWHQDHFYVRGHLDTVTAWLPLQDTGLEQGCLQVMPRTHRLGPLDHDGQVLGKRHHPMDLDHEIRLVPAKAGDVVLFHSCLLHSGSVNLGDRLRLSVQARYTPLGSPIDPGMGRVIELPEAQ